MTPDFWVYQCEYSGAWCFEIHQDGEMVEIGIGYMSKADAEAELSRSLMGVDNFLAYQA